MNYTQINPITKRLKLGKDAVRSENWSEEPNYVDVYSIHKEDPDPKKLDREPFGRMRPSAINRVDTSEQIKNMIPLGLIYKFLCIYFFENGKDDRGNGYKVLNQWIKELSDQKIYIKAKENYYKHFLNNEEYARYCINEIVEKFKGIDESSYAELPFPCFVIKDKYERLIIEVVKIKNKCNLFEYIWSYYGPRR